MATPLFLAPFEEYMLVDDRRAYPMSFFVRLCFAGVLDESALQKAFRVALERHRLLTATVKPAGRNRWVWMPDKHRPAPIWTRVSSTADAYPPAGHIDLYRQNGLRAWVVIWEDSSELVLQFHHACCDGLGAYQFVSDLLIAYARAKASGPADCELPPNNVERLESRNTFGLTSWKRLQLAPRQMVGLLGARQFLMRNPEPVIPYTPDVTRVEPPVGYPAACGYSFDVETTARIFLAARRQRATVNDLLSRDLFLALDDFRLRHHGGDERDWLRLTIPLNLRGGADHTTPAANIMSYVFLDRQRPDCADRGRLLRSVHDEVDFIKRWQLGHIFLYSLQLARMLPGGMLRAARKVKCEATCVFSNLGRPLADCRLPRQEGKIVAANVTLEHTELLPPIRPYTCASVSVSTYADRLSIAMHYDPAALSPGQSRDLLETFAGHIEESACEQGASGVHSVQAESAQDG